jgi:hypothetical protein
MWSVCVGSELEMIITRNDHQLSASRRALRASRAQQAHTSTNPSFFSEERPTHATNPMRPIQFAVTTLLLIAAVQANAVLKFENWSARAAAAAPHVPAFFTVPPHAGPAAGSAVQPKPLI